MLPTINTPDRQAEAFPVLTPAQIDRLRPYGNIRSVRAAEVLFEPGKSGMSCFVVLSGKLDIAVSGLSGEQVFVTYGPFFRRFAIHTPPIMPDFEGGWTKMGTSKW